MADVASLIVTTAVMATDHERISKICLRRIVELVVTSTYQHSEPPDDVTSRTS